MSHAVTSSSDASTAGMRSWSHSIGPEAAATMVTVVTGSGPRGPHVDTPRRAAGRVVGEVEVVGLLHRLSASALVLHS